MYLSVEQASRLGAAFLRKGSGKVTRGPDDVVLCSKENEARLQKLGKKLLDKGLTLRNRKVLRSILNGAMGPNVYARIRFSLSETSHGVPWEILWESALRQYVTLDPRVSVVRSIAGAQLVAPGGPIRDQLRVLLVAPHPIGQDSTGAAQEEHGIKVALKKLEKAGAVVVRWVKPATVRSFRQALRGRWHIVHFIGHGSFEREQSWLLFEREDKREHLVNGTSMANMVQGTHPRLVVLNACVGAKTGAAALPSVALSLCRQGIPAVIAMQNAITNDAAIAFSGEIYSQLAMGTHVDQAVERARSEVELVSNQLNPQTLEWFTPVLYLGAPDGDVLKLRRLMAGPRTMPPATTALTESDGPLDPAKSISNVRATSLPRHSEAAVPAAVKADGSVRSKPQSDDPQKERWGGLAERNGRKLSAKISKVKGSKEWYEITVTVAAVTSAHPLKGQVTFHLHPTFRESRQVVEVENGRASLSLLAWGAFTVGAEADRGATKLELDLSEVAGAPRAFKGK